MKLLVIQKPKKIIDIHSLKDIFHSISWETIEKLAFLSIMAYILTPVTQFFASLYYDILFDSVHPYYVTFKYASRFSLVLCIPITILYIGKNIVEKYSIRRFFKDNPAMLFFIPYVILMIVSTFINGFTTMAMRGGLVRRESLFVFIMYFLVYYFQSSIIENKKLKSIINYTFLLGGLFIGLLMLVHIYIHPIKPLTFEGYETMITAIFFNSNHYAYYLTMIVIMSGGLFILEKNKLLKYLCLASFTVNTVILIINNTLGCYISSLLGLLFTAIVIGICGKKFEFRLFIPLILFILITFLMSFAYKTVLSSLLVMFIDIKNIYANEENSDSAGSGRWRLWKATIKYISEKPIFGFGTDGIYKRLVKEAGNARTHNEFLQYTAFYGIPAGIMYVAGDVSVFIKGLKYRYKLDIYTLTGLAAAFGYLVSSFFGTSFFYTSPFLFIFLGIGLSGKKHA